MFEPLDPSGFSVLIDDNVMSELDELIGKRIAEARVAAGLTQAQLAEQVNIATENLSRAERGRTVLRTRKLVAMADALGVSLDDLARGREVIPRRGTAVARLVRLVEGLDEETAGHLERVVRAFLDAVGRR